MKKSLDFSDWIDIATALFTDVQKCLSDDGRISLTEGIGLAVSFLRAINNAVKTS